jgi:hypothetical protein
VTYLDTLEIEPLRSGRIIVRIIKKDEKLCDASSVVLEERDVDWLVCALVKSARKAQDLQVFNVY